jgi:hypothetical protein
MSDDGVAIVGDRSAEADEFLGCGGRIDRYLNRSCALRSTDPCDAVRAARALCIVAALQTESRFRCQTVAERYRTDVVGRDAFTGDEFTAATDIAAGERAGSTDTVELSTIV